MFTTKTNPVLSEALTWDTEDPWGWAGQGGFAVAGILYALTGSTPEHWEYSPGATGIGFDPDNYADLMVADAAGLYWSESDFMFYSNQGLPGESEAAAYLTHAGEVFHRYAAIVPEEDRY